MTKICLYTKRRNGILIPYGLFVTKRFKTMIDSSHELTIVLESVDHVIASPCAHPSVVEGIRHVMGVDRSEEIVRWDINVIPIQIV